MSLTHSVDFEEVADINGSDFFFQQGTPANRITIITPPQGARDGTKCVSLHTEPGDSGAPVYVRADITAEGTGASTGTTHGGTQYFGFSMCFPTPAQDVDWGVGYLWDGHGDGSGAWSTHANLHVADGQLYADQNSGPNFSIMRPGGVNHFGGFMFGGALTAPGHGTGGNFTFDPITLGQWLDVVLGATWHHTSAIARTKIWVRRVGVDSDYVLKLDNSDPNCFTEDGVFLPSYWKLANYNTQGVGTGATGSTVFYDRFRGGTTYEDVALPNPGGIIAYQKPRLIMRA